MRCSSGTRNARVLPLPVGAFTSSWKVNREHFQCFVLDEADRLLDLGFEKQVKMIFNNVVRNREDAHNGGSNFGKGGGKGSSKGNKRPDEVGFRPQTMLVSATLTPGVQKLADFCLRGDRAKVGFSIEGGDERTVDWAIPSTLQQYSLVCPTKSRLPCLISTILQNAGKVVVFFSSCASVDFHYDLFTAMQWPLAPEEIDSKGTRDAKNMGEITNYKGGFVGVKSKKNDEGGNDSDDADDASDMEESSWAPSDSEDDGRNKGKKNAKHGGGKKGKSAAAKKTKSSSDNENPRIFENVTVHRLHGNLSAVERTGFLRDFLKPGTNSVLLASDVVARGVDLPKMDWIIQYDPPAQVEEYLHRIGRTARCGNVGKSLLFLQPNEEKYLGLLKARMSFSEADAEESALEKATAAAAGEAPNNNKSKKDPVEALSLEKVKQHLRTHLPNHSPLLKIRDLNGFLSAQLTRFVSDAAKDTSDPERVGLLHGARKGFLSWMKSYATFPRQLKTVFNVRVLNPGHVAANFCLSEPPKQIAQSYQTNLAANSASGSSSGKPSFKKKQSSGSKLKLRLSDRLAATTENYSKRPVRKGQDKRNQGGSGMESNKIRAGDAFKAAKSDKLFERKEKTQRKVEKRIKAHDGNTEFM